MDDWRLSCRVKLFWTKCYISFILAVTEAVTVHRCTVMQVGIGSKSYWQFQTGTCWIDCLSAQDIVAHLVCHVDANEKLQ